MGKYRKQYWEFGSLAKASAVSVHSADLNVGNIAVQQGLASDLSDAIDAVSIGTPGSIEHFATFDEVGRTPSANAAAQRENKWLVSFVDNTTGFAGSFTIPCADLDQLGTDGEEMATGANRTALVSAVEAFVLSKAGNAVTVTGIRFSARNI